MTIKMRIEKLEAALPVPIAQGDSAKQRLLDLLDKINSDGIPRLRRLTPELETTVSVDPADTRSPAEKLQAILDGTTRPTERKDEP